MSKRGSFSGSPSRSPSPIASPLSLSPMLAAAGSLSITRQEIALPEVPSYEQSQADPFGLGPPLLPSKGIAADDWIVGTHEAVREIMVMHNPNPTGNFSDLDMRQQGVAPGIGVWDLKIFSDVVSNTTRLKNPKLTNSSPSAALSMLDSPYPPSIPKRPSSHGVYSCARHIRSLPRGTRKPSSQSPLSSTSTSSLKEHDPLRAFGIPGSSMRRCGAETSRAGRTRER